MLVKLGALDTGRIADLRPYFDSMPDPRARRGRWYSLTAILLVCACAAVSGSHLGPAARPTTKADGAFNGCPRMLRSRW
ncbi:hypothetical protein [Streptomyces sp. NPDC060022]|uniref:hypothetical protein n=1 Tax=Streptomyces sp. NPDC060022 TaxID=3347039 RepID=UPI0036B7CDC0